MNAQYIAKIANMSTGRGEYAALMQKAHEEDVVRQAKFKQVRPRHKTSRCAAMQLPKHCMLTDVMMHLDASRP